MLSNDTNHNNNWNEGGAADPYNAKSIAVTTSGPAMPENEEEILRFLDSAVLEEQPTEILVQLAQKLKERRSKLYTETVIPAK